MYEYNGKVYRSLEEQVQKNMDDIEELKKVPIPEPTSDWKPCMVLALSSLEKIAVALDKVAWAVSDGQAYIDSIIEANEALEEAIDAVKLIYMIGNTLYIKGDTTTNQTDRVLYIRDKE